MDNSVTQETLIWKNHTVAIIKVVILPSIDIVIMPKK